MPSLTHCAAVDLGATSGRVIVGSYDGDRLSLTEVHRFPNQFRSLGTHDYWDIPTLWSEITAGLRAAVARFPDLASVGVDTWGVDHVLTDAHGQLVYPAHAYRDSRTAPILQHLANSPSELADLYRHTGIPNLFYNTSLQLRAALAAHPSLAQLASNCLLLPDYFNFLLSGKMVNELTIASTTQLLDVSSNTWSTPALTRFGIPARWFTPAVLPGQTLGPVTSIPELAAVQVVVVPGHDTACAFDAMPASPDGTDLFLSSGTWSLVGFESPLPLNTPPALAAGISNERTSTGQYRPVANIIGLWLLEGTLKDFASRPQSDAQWADLLSAAESLPPPQTLLDVNDPAFSNPPSMRAAIDAQLAARSAPLPTDLPAYTRLICDSLGRSHALALERFQSLSPQRFTRILMVGGGSKNRLLCQATANAARLPVISLEVEGSAVGNIARQLLALNATPNLPTFRAHYAKHLKQATYDPH